MTKKKPKIHPQKFYELRTRLGMTQAEVAVIIGVSGPITISKWENGHLPIPQYALVILDLLRWLKTPKDYRPPSGK